MKSLVVVAGFFVSVVGTAHAEPKAEDTVGTWRGRATWKGCSVSGNAQASVDVTWKDGLYHATLTALRDDLGTVDLAPQGDGTAAGTHDDLKVTFKPGASAKLTLATDAGCIANVSLARDGSGIAACDRVLALASIESQCEAIGDARTADLEKARASVAGWKKLKGKAKKTAGDACTKDADAISAALTQASCLPGAGTSGVPECDAYVETLRRYAQCNALPVDTKQALMQAVSQMSDAWKPLHDPNTPPEAKKAAADACKQAIDALRVSAQGQGCQI
ncbi:MAG TPA: hypothetical protein VL463_36790 [Kofleriaceae bacterium]|nr:hypothetical protein [Kofleriaceae bacterium]